MDTRLLRSALAFAALLAVLQILASTSDPDPNALTWIFLAAGIVTLSGRGLVLDQAARPAALVDRGDHPAHRRGLRTLPTTVPPAVVKVMAALFIALTAVVIWVLSKAKNRLSVRAA